MPSFNPSAPYFSERLQMRPPVMADLERFYAIFGDPQTNASTPPARSPAKRRPLRRCRSGSPSGGNTATAPGRSPCANGRIGLSVLAACPGSRSARSAPLTSAIASTPGVGQGLATEMALASLQYGFVGLELGEISAIVRAENQASWRVLEKIGMQRVDTLDDVPGAAPSLVYTLKRGDYQG